MCFTVRKINIMLSLLLVVVCSWGQVTDAKNFTITPQTVVKTNLPKQAPCLFELQDILRERFGQSAIMGGLRAKGNSVIELWTDSELEGKEHYILDISANKQIAPQHIEKCKKLNLLPTSHQTNRILYPGIIQLIPKPA
jgi:hypothetical protein